MDTSYTARYYRRMWFTYIYAVKLPSGRLVGAGHDFAQTMDSYKAWYDAEMSKALDERHIIHRWRHQRCEVLKAHQKPGHDTQKPVAAPMTGNVKALQVLADDIYQLEHALKTPRQILDRLRDQRQFQGATNEITVASIFAPCGF